MVAIIDYDAGNIRSVEKAVNALGRETVVTREKEKLLCADRVILPGVGAFGDAMNKLHSYGLEEVIGRIVGRGTPFLGICLGLQLLFEKSGESETVPGLGLLKGEICRFPDKEGLKIPHVGWNSLSFPRKSRLFQGIEEGAYVYFVHSYYLRAADEGLVTAVADYGVPIHAAVERDNLFACQFHPEKSSARGLSILNNFLNAK